MKKEAKGFIAGILITSIISAGIPAFASNAAKAINLSFNSVKIALNGKQVPVENLVYNGSTYVKLTQVCDLIGKTASYDKKTKTVNIKDKITVITTDPKIDSEAKPVTDSKPGPTDNTELKLEKFIGISQNSIQLVFNKELDKESAENEANYIIKEKYGAKKQLTVSSAELCKEKNSVLITCNDAKLITLYDLELNIIKDVNGNTIKPGITSIIVLFGKNISKDVTPPINNTPAPTTPPDMKNEDEKFALEAAIAPSNDSVQIYYNHKVDAATAGNVANYSIKSSDGTSLSISSCNCEPSGNTVMLKTAKLSTGTYTLTASNVKDIYGNSLGNFTVVFAGNTASN